MKPEDIGQFDIIITRDVLEHIHEQDKFMGFVKKFMKLVKLLIVALFLVCFALQVPASAQPCGTDPDGDDVYSRSCDLTDQYARAIY